MNYVVYGVYSATPGILQTLTSIVIEDADTPEDAIQMAIDTGFFTPYLPLITAYAATLAVGLLHVTQSP